MVLSNSFEWKTTNQERLHHSVDKAIEIISDNPRETTSINPATWKGNSQEGHYWIRCSGGPMNMYFTHKVPQKLVDSFPVLIGVRNGAKFLIDGAHRLVRAKMDNAESILAVELSEDETKACIIAGREEYVDDIFKHPFPV